MTAWLPTGGPAVRRSERWWAISPQRFPIPAPTARATCSSSGPESASPTGSPSVPRTFAPRSKTSSAARACWYVRADRGRAGVRGAPGAALRPLRRDRDRRADGNGHHPSHGARPGDPPRADVPDRLRGTRRAPVRQPGPASRNRALPLRELRPAARRPPGPQRPLPRVVAGRPPRRLRRRDRGAGARGRPDRCADRRCTTRRGRFRDRRRRVRRAPGAGAVRGAEAPQPRTAVHRRRPRVEVHVLERPHAPVRRPPCPAGPQLRGRPARDRRLRPVAPISPIRRARSCRPASRTTRPRAATRWTPTRAAPGPRRTSLGHGA